MATRNPNKTARNKRVKAIKEERKMLQKDVFKELEYVENGKYCNEQSLNAFIGSKIDDYIDLKNDVIKTPDEFISKWIKGLVNQAGKTKELGLEPRHVKLLELLKSKNKPTFKKYVLLFLEGTFLKKYESYCKAKPKTEESEYWFGDNGDVFGLLVTPRFENGAWENDKSEIRHFKHPYWTISHVVNVGLRYFGEERECLFKDIDTYLEFFYRTVRMSKSKYQLKIASLYIDYVKKSKDPDSIPLLIPELRYDPFKNKHEHRLDFLIINPWSMSKVGFEISPWSTHGKLKGKDRKMSEYNKDAKNNFEKEMKKHKQYWRKYGINYITYTDEDLKDIDNIWREIKSFLEVPNTSTQLEIHLIDELLK